jgi:o-succinylbenzoate synthase
MATADLEGTVAALRRHANGGAGAAVSAEVVEVALPLRRAHIAAHGTERVRRAVLVGLTAADGTTGWGECSALTTPGYSHEHVDGAWQDLTTRFVPAVLTGNVPVHGDRPMAMAAVEAAAIDLDLRRHQGRLVDVLGGQHVLDRCTVVSGGSSDHTVDAVATAVAGGATMVKLKLTPVTGIDVLRAVRSRWPSLPMAADANGSLAGCDDLLDELASLRLAYLEQPLPPDDLAGNALAARRAGTMLALDESVGSVDAARRAVATCPGVIVNVKPARLGGLAVALEVASVVVAGGGQLVAGGMLETGIGRASAVALAAAFADVGPGDPWPTDLGPADQYVTQDLTDPVVVNDAGRLVVPRGPGAGVAVHLERIAAHAIRSIQLNAS